MKRRWNCSLWTGFLLVLAGLLSYVPLFALFLITRDFPWVNLLLLGAGVVFLFAGVRRAFKQPDVFRGKIFGSIMAVFSLAGIWGFCFGRFFWGGENPGGGGAPRVG